MKYVDDGTTASNAQMFFDEANKFAKDDKIIINESKTKVMVFNLSKTFNFLLKLYQIVSNDLKWHNNTFSIILKARKRIWVLRRFKKLQFDSSFLLEIYTKEIRPLLVNDTKLIENIQKDFFQIKFISLH